MGKYLQSSSFLQSLHFNPFRIFISSKVFHFRQLSMIMLFCLGGDADFDFIDKNFASVKVNHDIQDLSLPTSATDYFRSYQSGDWSLNSTWESSPDNTNWQAATEVPTKDANKISIQSSHNVFVSSAVSLDELSVAGMLELQTGGMLNINDGVGDDIMISANGVLQVTSNDTYAATINQAAGANIHIGSNGKILIGNGANVGTGYENFATSLINVWDNKSVYEFNSSSTFITASLTYFPNETPIDIPIFRVSKVAGTAANGAGKDFYVNGLFELNTNISFSGAGDRYFRNGIRGTATLSQTGVGQFYLTASGAILDGTPLRMVLSSNLKLMSSSTIFPGATVIISGANIDNNLAGNIFTIDGTLDVNDFGIKNTNGSIILNGFYRTTNIGGFSGGGSSIVSGNITVNTGSTIELYASGDQSLNARTDFKNLIFSGSGIKTPTGSFNPAGTVIIKEDAIFDCSGRNIGDETFGQPTSTNLTMTGNSRLIVTTVNTNPKMGGIYNLTGGVVEFKCNNLTPQTIRSKNYQNIEITGTNVLMSDGNITLNDIGTFTIKNGGIFTINDNTIDGPIGSQTVTVESGGIFKCGTNKGFHGFTITAVPIKSSAVNSDIETIILEPNSVVEYSRSSPPLADGDQPITNTNGLIYQNLILSGTGNKTAPADDLIIQGNLSKTGSCTFIHNDGTVIFNGSSAQSYDATFPVLAFNSLSHENLIALNVNSELSVYKKLVFAANSKINLNADVTLKSDKNGTANVAKIPSNSTINYNAGRFVVERYINSGSTAGSHGKSWQLLSAPAFEETIYNTWQESGNTLITGFGTWITDPSGIANGFDASSVSPSVKTFNFLNQSFEGISNTNLPVADPRGYFVYVRGDRTVRNAAAAATPATLRVRGKLFRDDQPAINVIANSYQSIGNPYASAIDFSKLITSNMDNSFYVWDPSILGNYNVGGYQTISSATGFIAVPGGSAIFASSTDYRNIQSGQAFMIHNASAVNGSIQFTEDCKITDGHHLVNRGASLRQMLFANLYNKDGLLTDGNAVVFDEDFSNNTDGDDAIKIPNSGENFGIKRNNKNLVVEARKPVSRPDTVFYELNNLKQENYRLVIDPKNMDQELTAFFIDRYLETETAINLNDSTWVDFSITPDAASFADDRFFVTFQQGVKDRTVPPSFIFINAYQKNKNILVEWKVDNVDNIDRYEIEHSVDGVQFLLRDKKNANGVVNSYLDESPVNGNNFYRIRGIDKNGASLTSPIVKVYVENLNSGISIYPNPVNGETIHLRFIEQKVGNYLLTLYNSSGEVLQTDALYHKEESENHPLKINKNFPPGIYILKIEAPGEIKEYLKIMK